MESKVVLNADVARQGAGEGVTRKVLAQLPPQMVVEVSFDAGARGEPHRHPHTQCTYVKSGEFTFTIEGRSFAVREGDTLAFASNELHGCTCHKQGVLIDVFAPMREDFLA